MVQGWIVLGALLLAQGAAAPAATEKAPPADAATAARAELERTVRGILREMEAPERAKRDAAEKQLLDLGPAALDVLPPLTPRSSAELKQRLDRVRAVLEMDRAEAFAKTSHVTLSGEHKLSVVLAEIEKQTGNRIIDYREEFGQEKQDPTLTVAFDNTPFWPAVDRVLDDAELTIYAYANQPGLALVARGSSQFPRAHRGIYSGAFRFEPAELSSRRDLRDPAGQSLTLQLEVAWEPRLAPLAIKQPLDELSATDDAGNPIGVSSAEGEIEAPLSREIVAVDLQIPLLLPPRSAKQIASLKGTMTALVPGGLEKFRFDDLAKAKQVEQRKGGAAVTLEQVRKNNALWEARIRIRFDNRTGALESHRNWLASAQVYLAGKEGAPLTPAATETTVSNEEEIGMAYLFDLPQGLDGMSLFYEAPAVILTLPIEYELKNLDLP